MGSLPTAQPERNLFNNDHGAGKGDKERGSKWRENYPAIEWGIFRPDMERRGVKQVKRYGTLAKAEPFVELPPCEHLYTKCGRCVDCNEMVAP
jgi:hypothetical protein